MRQISLKLNTYVRSINIINNNIEKLVLNVIFLSFGALAFFYVLLLGNMVKNIVERQNLEVQARSLSSEVRNLEVTYLSMSNDIDLNFSHSLGFKETQATFVTRQALGLNSTGGSFGSIKIVKNDL